MMSGALEGVPVKGFARPSFKVMRGDAIRVPGVSGMSVDQARNRLQAAGFSVNVAGQRVRSLGAPKGRVAYSSPGGGQSAFQGQTVTLFISSGPPPIPQPDPEPPPPPDDDDPPGGGGGPDCEKNPGNPNCPPPPGLGPSG
jgi:hypothetical protein